MSVQHTNSPHMSALDAVKTRLERACGRAGRDPSSVTLVAVTKGRSAEEIETQLLTRGHLALGESRVQEWRTKAAGLAERGWTPEWHFIGNLQTNKVKYCLPFYALHSLNSQRLAEALEAFGERRGHRFRVFVEVNVTGEASKQGVPLAGAEALVRYAQGLPHLEVLGLMTIAPYSSDSEASRPVFRALRELRDRLALGALSMGMSGDFEVAVEEGATHVRVGSALFSSATQPL
jgi:pyridoxal phosphate enzyme (YggS family)